MAPNNEKLYARLKRLFSSDVIIRKTRDLGVKVADINNIQTIATSNVTDKYNRIHQSSRNLGYSFALTYFAQRLDLFRDYEAMDADPIIHSALDIYADECTVKNELDMVLSIKCENEKIREILENLYYDILNVEFTLWPWIRNLVKYGDFFLYLEIADGIGIINVMPISVYEIRREEGTDPDIPGYVKFTLEGPTYSRGELENFEVAHFRLLSDSNYLPYGRSMIERARRVWKQLSLMEDAMLIHRIMRAPERRVFNIDIGNIAPDEVDAYMAKVIAQIKKVPFIDERTGEYNLKFNLMNMLEDFYLPTRGGDSGTSIESLSGLEFNSIDDIEYLRNKMMASLKIPKAFLGYEEEVGSKATLAAEDVRFARTIQRIQRIIVSELEKIGIIHLYSQGYTGEELISFDLSLTNPSTILEQEQLEIWNSKVQLARDIEDLKMIGSDWIYEHIFKFSSKEIERSRLNVIKDIKRRFRHEQIEAEGNDPAQSGQAFTDGDGESDNDSRSFSSNGNSYPEDNQDEKRSLNLNFDDLEEVESERYRKKLRFRDQDEPFGRDPLGKHDYSTSVGRNTDLTAKARKQNRKNQLKRKAESIASMLSPKHRSKKKKLHDHKTNAYEYFLSEDNILGDDGK